MSENETKNSVPELTRDEGREVAELYESRYFAALTRVADALESGALCTLKSKATSDSDMRFWQGYVNGVAEVALTIRRIAQQLKKPNNV